MQRTLFSAILERIVDGIDIYLPQVPKQESLGQEIFYSYCHQGGLEESIPGATFSRWKKGDRHIVDSVIYYYSNHPETLLEDCTERVIPILEDARETMEDVCCILRRSSLPRKKIETLCGGFTALDEETYGVFLRDVWLYSMKHKEVYSEMERPPAPEKMIGADVPMPCRYFCGRDRELEQLRYILEENNGKCFLNGISGIGKTELAKEYAVERSQGRHPTCQTVFFTSFQGSVRRTIAGLKMEGDEQIISRYEAMRDALLQRCSEEHSQESAKELARISAQMQEELFQAHHRCLLKLGRDTLWILDHFDRPLDQDEDISILLNYGMQIIVTTEFYSEALPHMTLTAMTEDENLLQLMQCFYGRAENFRQEVLDIAHVLHGHTVLLVVAAHLLNKGAVSPGKLLSILEEGGLKIDLDMPVEILKDGRPVHRSCRGFVDLLFPLFQLQDEEKAMLRCLSLIPVNGLPMEVFQKWIQEIPNFSDTIDSLSRQGLVTLGDGKIILEGLIRDVIYAREETEPSIEGCSPMLEYVADACSCLHNSLTGDENLFAAVINTAVHARKDDEYLYADLLLKAFPGMHISGHRTEMKIVAGELSQLSERHIISAQEDVAYCAFACACAAEEPEAKTAAYAKTIHAMTREPGLVMSGRHALTVWLEGIIHELELYMEKEKGRLDQQELRKNVDELLDDPDCAAKCLELNYQDLDKLYSDDRPTDAQGRSLQEILHLPKSVSKFLVWQGHVLNTMIAGAMGQDFKQKLKETIFGPADQGQIEGKESSDYQES